MVYHFCPQCLFKHESCRMVNGREAAQGFAQALYYKAKIVNIVWRVGGASVAYVKLRVKSGPAPIAFVLLL